MQEKVAVSVTSEVRDQTCPFLMPAVLIEKKNVTLRMKGWKSEEGFTYCRLFAVTELLKFCIDM